MRQRTLLAAAFATALTGTPLAWAAEPAGMSGRPTAPSSMARNELNPPPPAAAVSHTPGVAPAPVAEPSWPITLPEAKAEVAAAPTQEIWPEEEIKRAKAHCAHVLKSVGAVAVPSEPIRDGMCGAAAPVQLTGLGASPQVAISPPATLTCEMVEALATWLKNDLQPLAQRHLGAPIVRLNSLSSYSCRRGPARAKNRLSEHGRANALDISGFVTASLQTTELLTDWGMTESDIRAQVAAAKAAAEQAAGAKQAMAKGAPPTSSPHGLASAQQGQEPAPVTQARSRDLSRGTIIEDDPDLAAGLVGLSPGRWSTSLGFAQPSRLGGPKEQQAARQPSPVPSEDRRAQFLREAHATACRIFGTVLGPESNEAHRNHFHLDMAERDSGPFCR